jgi:hypothetical protein
MQTKTINRFDIELTKPDMSKTIISSEQFYEVALKRNLTRPYKVFDAKKKLLAGETVDGTDVAMKGMFFKKV